MKLFIFVLLLALLLSGCSLLSSSTNSELVPIEKDSSPAIKQSEFTEGLELGDVAGVDQLEVLKLEPYDLKKVARVIDGDTIELESGEKVRYIGIDTPESVSTRTSVQCFGKEAWEYNRFLVEEERVSLEKDITDRDKYGRLLRYVYVGEIMVNLKLVQEGYATSYTYPPDIKYQEQFMVAEQQAREQNKGLWGNCK
ncbi:MAG: thermonuclease family protein [Patescibacteria group bacterium]